MKLSRNFLLLIVALFMLAYGVANGANLLLNPGFESGASSWTETSSGGYSIIDNSTSWTAHAGSYYAWMGGYNYANDVIYQSVIIPSNAQTATVQFWYAIGTEEIADTGAYDFMVVDLYSVASGAKLATLKTLSNLDATGWVQSAQFDVSAYKGQTVQLRFAAINDSLNITSFMLDDVSLATSATAQANAATPMVAAGREYAIALKSDGTLTAWGRNDYGQLGNGQAAMRVTPTKVDGIDRVTAAVAGNSVTLVLRDDGTVWGWGGNVNGQLGDGTTQNKSHPVQVTGLSGAVESIAISQEHALAVTTDGNVWAWGWGPYGQLGNGGTGNSLSALKVSGLPAVRSVAAGDFHSLALAGDGTVWAWGDNSNGQLGDGTTTQRSTPVRVGALSDIVAISTTSTHNLALDSSGRVWAWGAGGWGELGDGSYSDRTTPFIVPGLPQITAIVAGAVVSVAVGADGSVWMWGDNEFGQFGDSAYSAQPSPVKVTTLTGFSGFSIGTFYVVARSPSGTLQAWGGNNYGQLGVGDANDRAAPAPVSASVQFAQASAGFEHTVAVASDGSVWAWGANGSGQLADGTVSVSNRPIDVQGPGDTVAVAAGRFHVLALGRDGSVWGWGGNANGELGDGSRRDSAVPQRVPALPAMSAIAAGNQFSLALEPNGNIWSWGDGTVGQLGNGQTYTQLTPEKLTAISGVTQLSANNHVLAVRDDGSVWAWGDNFFGQLGDGATTNRSTPARVNGLSDVVAVAAGGFHSLALDSSGSVWAWGSNSVGELGDGTDIDRHTPVKVAGLSDVAAISAGENSSYAITRDGRLWAWGWNGEEELGTGSLDDYSLLARPIVGIDGFQGIAGGVGSAVALRTDGTVWAWGSNFEGQVGDATFAQHDTPVLTVNATVDGALDLNPQVANSIPPDKVPPFFALTDRAGDLSKLTVSTTIKFSAAHVGNLGTVTSESIRATKLSAADAGTSGAVFVTAWAPSNGLAALGILAAPTNHAMSVTVTNDDPYSGSAIRTRQEILGSVLVAADANTFVLIQKTSSGWQLVVNGQLIPYASGVLDAQLATQTILSNTDTTNLKGAEFCEGYGTSAEEMTAAGRMRVVLTIPVDPNSTATTSGSCNVAAVVSAIEFYKSDIDHYFMTASTDEAKMLDNKPEWNWVRTDKTFNIWPTQALAPGNASPVCRFYGLFSNGTIGSHFYTVDTSECEYVKSRLDWSWASGYEGYAFYAVKPAGTSCPTGTASIYRAYNNGKSGAPNHRYVATQAEVDAMVAQGWVSEGTAFCGVQ